MRKCNQQCKVDQFFIEREQIGLRCYECNKTFIETDLNNPTIELLDEYKKKEAEEK